MKRLSLTLLICIALVGVASAHDPGISTVMVKAVSDRLEVSATFSRKDIEGLLAPQRRAALEHAARGPRTTGLGASRTPESAAFDARFPDARVCAPPLPWAAETQSLGENEDPKLGWGEGQTGSSTESATFDTQRTKTRAVASPLPRGEGPTDKNLSELARETVKIEQDGKALHPIAHHIGFAGEDNVEVRLTFNSDASGKLTFHSPLLERFAPGHRQLLSVTDANGR